MAKAKVILPDDLVKKLNNVSDNLDKNAERALKSGAKVIEHKLGGILKSSISPKSSGELYTSLGISPVKRNKHDYLNIKVGFNEPRRKQYMPRNWHISSRYGAVADRGYYKLTNALIENVLEHGKKNQPAKFIINRTFNAAEQAAIKEVVNIFESIWGDTL